MKGKNKKPAKKGIIRDLYDATDIFYMPGINAPGGNKSSSGSKKRSKRW